MHIIEADALATRGSADVVARATTADLTLATPCTGWDLRALLAHMTAQHRGFAAAANGHGDDLAIWGPDDTGEPLTAYAQAVDPVLDAFAVTGVLERPFALPELGRVLPGRIAVGFHLVDYVVHGWDVARTIGVDWQLAPGVLDAALVVAEAVPKENRVSFAPALPVPDDAGTLDRILLLLGRDPHAVQGGLQ
ncbi:TIGR03086 family metal-binding protein [Winogradskya consettensis]|uniref:TIGR03086 family protein n=1 Tax=Winogradskya consettensis TaxID=113560 RepID=A0A919SJG0_9ACTN|nr:TIGR03086 family metal-binding protein [Actinoplanes consettensis]GIM73875.1 TIGR03086 family protein [Actinoplanes consettensis]